MFFEIKNKGIHGSISTVSAQEQSSFIVKLTMPSPYSKLIQDPGGVVIMGAKPAFLLFTKQSHVR